MGNCVDCIKGDDRETRRIIKQAQVRSGTLQNGYQHLETMLGQEIAAVESQIKTLGKKMQQFAETCKYTSPDDITRGDMLYVESILKSKAMFEHKLHELHVRRNRMAERRTNASSAAHNEAITRAEQRLLRDVIQSDAALDEQEEARADVIEMHDSIKSANAGQLAQEQDDEEGLISEEELKRKQHAFFASIFSRKTSDRQEMTHAFDTYPEDAESFDMDADDASMASEAMSYDRNTYRFPVVAVNYE